MNSTHVTELNYNEYVQIIRNTLQFYDGHEIDFVNGTLMHARMVTLCCNSHVGCGVRTTNASSNKVECSYVRVCIGTSYCVALKGALKWFSTLDCCFGSSTVYVQ